MMMSIQRTIRHGTQSIASLPTAISTPATKTSKYLWLLQKPTSTLPSPATASSFSRRYVHIEKRLVELGIQLPPAPTPKANYNIVCYASGNMMYVSGHLPILLDGTLITGSIGPTTSGGESIEHGYKAARQAGLNIISTLKEQLGDLDRVEQIVKVRLCFFYPYFSRRSFPITATVYFTY